MFYLIGAGPGDPELLTLKAIRHIAEADLILYDYLVDERALEYAKKDARLIALGHPYSGCKVKQVDINRQMVEAATAGLTVVRLKGGDPHLFGRLNEEMQCLIDAGIPFQVVPGVTSASVAAQVAGISLTDRHHASAVAFITGHLSHEHDPALPVLDFGQFADFPGTLVFYMGVRTVKLWSEALLKNGKLPQTLVMIVYHASWVDQKTVQTTLGEAAAIIKQENLQSPCIIIVGDAITAVR
jgi:uroporphyrinogen III methyltransferase/synthase